MASIATTETQNWLHNQINGAIALIVLAVFFVALRTIGVRLVNRKKEGQKNKQSLPVGWDDALIVLSLVAFIPLCACAIVDGQASLAYYSSTGPEELTKHYLTLYKASYAFSVVYPVACVLPKLSICCMYLGLFRVKPPIRKAVHALIGFLIFNAIAWFIPSVVVCRPISTYWSPAPHPKKCIDYNVFGTWISLPHIVTDLIMIGLPMPLIWTMQMRRARKIGLMITFLTASIGIVGGCLRLAFYIHRTYVDRLRTTETPKQIAANFIVSYLEPGMYLVAACLPRLRSLLSQLHALFSTSVYPILARSRDVKEMSPSADSLQGRAGWTHRSRAPHLDMRPAGQGQLDTRPADEEEEAIRAPDAVPRLNGSSGSPES